MFEVSVALIIRYVTGSFDALGVRYRLCFLGNFVSGLDQQHSAVLGQRARIV